MEDYLKQDIKSLFKEKKIMYIEPKRDHLFTIIWLHGYGDTHLGFYELFQSNINPFGDHTKIVIPCAPLIKTSAQPAYYMNSWFNIMHLKTQDLIQNIDENEINLAVKFISQIIKHEVQIINNQFERLFLGGFSQGFTLSLKVGLEYEQRLGGVLGFCGINLNFNDRHRNRLPLFIGMSKHDSVINFQLASESFEDLESNRKDYNFCLFVDHTSGHTITTQGYKRLEEFYNSLLNRYVQ